MAATLDIYGVGVTMAGGVVITVVEPIPLIAAFNAYALVAYMIGSLAVAIMVVAARVLAVAMVLVAVVIAMVVVMRATMAMMR